MTIHGVFCIFPDPWMVDVYGKLIGKHTKIVPWMLLWVSCPLDLYTPTKTPRLIRLVTRISHAEFKNRETKFSGANCWTSRGGSHLNQTNLHDFGFQMFHLHQLWFPPKKNGWHLRTFVLSNEMDKEQGFISEILGPNDQHGISPFGQSSHRSTWRPSILLGAWVLRRGRTNSSRKAIPGKKLSPRYRSGFRDTGYWDAPDCQELIGSMVIVSLGEIDSTYE